jgi:hypothetical protein
LHVALQRKCVKSIELAKAAELIRKCLKIPKELLRKGASGVQTLYMTDRMQINQNRRAKAIPQALIDGLY